MKSYLISELVAFSGLSDSSNHIIAAAAILSVLSDWSIRAKRRYCFRLLWLQTPFFASWDWCLMLCSKNRSGRFRITYLLSTVLSTKSSPPLMEHIAPKRLRLSLRRRDGHLIAEVDNLLLIGLIRPVSCDRARSLLIERDILHTPVMHPSWGVPSQAASWIAQTSLAVIFAMALFSFPHGFFLSPSGEAAGTTSNRCPAPTVGGYALDEQFKIGGFPSHGPFFFRSSPYCPIVPTTKEKTPQ